MRKRLKSIAAAIALLGASVGFALGVAEMALRLFPERCQRKRWRGSMGAT